MLMKLTPLERVQTNRVVTFEDEPPLYINPDKIFLVTEYHEKYSNDNHVSRIVFDDGQYFIRESPEEVVALEYEAYNKFKK